MVRPVSSLPGCRLTGCCSWEVSVLASIPSRGGGAWSVLSVRRLHLWHIARCVLCGFQHPLFLYGGGDSHSPPASLHPRGRGSASSLMQCLCVHTFWCSHIFIPFQCRKGWNWPLRRHFRPWRRGRRSALCSLPSSVRPCSVQMTQFVATLARFRLLLVWYQRSVPSQLHIIIIIFINCNWVVTRWQWLFYMYTKYEIGYY